LHCQHISKFRATCADASKRARQASSINSRIAVNCVPDA
jgi:hypothetical protein